MLRPFFCVWEGEESPSLLFRQAKGCIKVGEPVEPSATPSSGCSDAAPVTPGLIPPTRPKMQKDLNKYAEALR